MSTAIRNRRQSVVAVILFLLAAALFLAPTRARAGAIDLYNWWGTNFSFNTTLRGQTRYYDLNNIGCDFAAYTKDASNGRGTTFQVELRRDHGIYYDGCGTRVANRNGSFKSDWVGVGAGDYYFYFSKAFDSQWVYCDAMGMYSW